MARGTGVFCGLASMPSPKHLCFRGLNLTCLTVSFAGGRVKTWKRRWFILTDNCLYYFEYTTVSTRRTDTRSCVLAQNESKALRKCTFHYFQSLCSPFLQNKVMLTGKTDEGGCVLQYGLNMQAWPRKHLVYTAVCKKTPAF